MVSQILRNQTDLEPQIRRYEIQRFENNPFMSTFREYRDEKLVQYLGHYGLPENMHARGKS